MSASPPILAAAVPALLASAAAALALAPTGRPALRGRLLSPGSAATSASPPTGAAPPSARRRRSALAALTGAGGALLLGGPVGLGVGVVLAVVVWRLSAGMEPPALRARREALAAATPLVVDLMAATLAAGTAPSVAVERIAAAIDEPMRGELLRLAAGLRYGADPVTAWRRLAADPHLGPVGRTVSRAVDGGASVAEAMHRLAEDLRRDRRADVEARARAVGVRAAVPLGVCMLPAFVLLGVIPLVAGFLPVVLGR